MIGGFKSPIFPLRCSAISQSIANLRVPFLEPGPIEGADEPQTPTRPRPPRPALGFAPDPILKNQKSTNRFLEFVHVSLQSYSQFLSTLDIAFHGVPALPTS